MIPRAYITTWRANARWQLNEQIEQDLVISRALVEIFSDDDLKKNLAFRGGTALHKLFLKTPLRYSEDIDLVQIKSEPIGKSIDRLREKLEYLGKPRVNQKEFNNTIVFRYDSEIPPVVSMKLKIEINCREHFAVYGHQKIPFSVSSRWFSGSCDIVTFKTEELLATKLRALYQRKKGRDLFDLYFALKEAKANPKAIVEGFRKYMEHEGNSVSRKEYLQNMEEKLEEDEFVNDIKNLITPKTQFHIGKAWEMVKSELIELL